MARLCYRLGKTQKQVMEDYDYGTLQAMLDVIYEADHNGNQ